MKIFDDTSLKKLISLIKGDINKKQDTITATGILTRDEAGVIDGIETETATLVDIPNGILKGDGTTISAAVAGVDYAEVPKATLVTLSASGWDSSAKTQTVSISGVLADENSQLIVPMPAIASQTAYSDSGILCTGQGANTVTFTCDSVPTADIKVYVFVQSVSTTA